MEASGCQDLRLKNMLPEAEKTNENLYETLHGLRVAQAAVTERWQ